jgi:tetratricopeptide (TPR) repeat protein
MIGRAHFKKAFVCVSILSASCLLLSGCTSFHRVYDYFTSRGEKGSDHRLSEKEIRQFASKVRVHRGNPDSHYLLACYYQQRGRHAEAIEEFNKTIFIDPRHVRAYNGKGVSHDRLGQFEKAAEAYEGALKIDPQLDYVHNNLGYSHLLRGNYDAAIAAFDRAIQLNGNSSRTRNNLGMAYAMKGDFRLAMEEFEKAGDRVAAHYLMARLYYERGLFDRAKEEYAEVLNLNPDFAGARKGLEASEALAEITQVAGGIPAAENGGKAIVSDNNREAKGPESLAVQDAGIEVSNGSGVNHMAKELGDYLKERGFNVVRLTNADHFNHTDGSIFCRKGYCDRAYELAMWLPGIKDVRETDRFDRERVKIKILVGKNQSRYRSLLMANRS